MPTMPHLFSPDGDAALAALMLHRPALLLAFDFDGTLAPIVARPGDARVPPALARCLGHGSIRRARGDAACQRVAPGTTAKSAAAG